MHRKIKIKKNEGVPTTTTKRRGSAYPVSRDVEEIFTDFDDVFKALAKR